MIILENSLLGRLLLPLWYLLCGWYQGSGLRVLLAKLVVNLGINVGLGALWSAILYGKGYYYYLAKSLVKNIGMWPLEAVLLFLFFKAILPVTARAGLTPKQDGVKLW